MNPTLSSYLATAIAAERLHAADRSRLVRLVQRGAGGQVPPKPAGTTPARARLRRRRAPAAQPR